MHVQTVIITGFSGAGKTTALNALEDIGYFCIDNLPVFLLPDLLRGMREKNPGPAKIALVMDCRDKSFIYAFPEAVAALKAESFDIEVLFLEAAEPILLRRYSQMRRLHPMAGGGTVRDGIAFERERITALRQPADHVIDTSPLTPHELRDRITKRYAGPRHDRLRISLISFGFKHELPADVDMVLDVRFLPNPFFVAGLRERTGLDPEVAAYVLDNETARRFLSLLKPMLSFLVPQYRREGKMYLTIGVGCTGGRHRSVAVIEAIRQTFEAEGQSVMVDHRDIYRDD